VQNVAKLVVMAATALVPSMALAGPVASDATGCAPGSRCISTRSSGRPASSGTYVAQCRGKFADFIVPKDTIRSGYSGPWFQPEPLENATTNGPAATRPWMQFDPREEDERLRYLLALRNYAFTSKAVRALTPTLTADSDYRDAAGGAVAQSLRDQKWYPAPRMMFRRPNVPGAREASHGMTLERRVRPGELGGNTEGFLNYAVAYYDARGAHTYQQVWSIATPGKDVPNRSAMKVAEGGLVYKLLFSAARAGAFPVDILKDSVKADVIPNAGGVKVPVRLLQIDIAVKDDRSDETGWYFATYAYDRSVSHSSPWRRMVPVGLMWGNDPGGPSPDLEETWINPDAPLYARNHLGVDGRLNGPVDNPDSACMSCHSTAQAESVADMLPEGECNEPPFRAKWFRNLKGSVAFGRFTPTDTACDTTPPANAPVAADYSLQLGATVTRAIQANQSATFNPCTWDTASPPSTTPPPAPPAAPGTSVAPVFEIRRDR